MIDFFKKKGALFISISLLIAVAGCQSLKAPSRSDKLWTTPRWEKSSKGFDNVWWRIRNQGIDTSEPLSLIDVIDIALQNNPSSRRVWQEARAAEAEKKQAESEWFPQVSSNADLTNSRRRANQKPDSYNTRSYGGGLQAAILAFDFGGRTASLKEKYHALLAANFDFNQAVQDLILDAEKAYYSLYSTKSALDAAAANVDDARMTFEAADAKYKAGLSSRLDLLQARANYDQALFSLEEAKGEVKDAKADLSQILGLSADTEFDIKPPSWEIPLDLIEEDISALIDEAIQKRSDVAASRADLLAKEAAVSAATSDLWPTLSLGGTADRRWTEYFGDSKAYKHYYEYTAYMKVAWDVFDGFDNWAKRKEAVADMKSQREQLREDELAASADVWSKYYAFRTATSKFEFSKAFLQSSEESFYLALEGYRAGLKDILDLLEAYSKLSSARSSYVQSKNDILVALAEIAHAVGSLGEKGSVEYMKARSKK